MMNTIQAIMERKSVRSYKSDQISDEALDRILQAGMAAPVSSNAYDTLHITVVQNQNIFSKINVAVTELIFKMTGKKMDKKIDNIIWGGAAAAVAQNTELQKELEIPDGYKPLLCISLGYAKEPEISKKHEITINKVV